MSVNASQTLGQWAEQEAKSQLEQSGFRTLVQNFHSRFGEIDLIVIREDLLLFVEVKARSQSAWGYAHEVIPYTKQLKIYKTALVFLQKFPECQQYFLRFDVVCFDFYREFAKSVQYDFTKIPYDLQWIENAFTLDTDLINLCD